MMSESETWTIGRLLEWTTDYFEQHDSDTPRLDAEVLLAVACECDRIDLYAAFNDEPPEPVRVAFRELVRRRAEGTPVAYLVGHREFYSLAFRVSDDVLIPRPETEHLVMLALDEAKSRAAGDRAVEIADVGTGSGVIAVCLAKLLPVCHLTATDISTPALDIARKNAEQHEVADRIDFLHSDLLSACPADRQFDLIVSNPPYVSQAELSTLEASVKDHEPEVALLGGPTGTEVIARLIEQARDRLPAGGWFACEISPMIESDVLQLIADTGSFTDRETTKDLAGLARVVSARKK